MAAGDVNGDGKADIIAGAGPAAARRSTVFNGTTGGIVAELLRLAPSFTGGVYVAAGDVNGDGKADIITGAGAGGGPQVTVFDGTTGPVAAELLRLPPRSPAVSAWGRSN